MVSIMLLSSDLSGSLRKGTICRASATRAVKTFGGKDLIIKDRGMFSTLKRHGSRARPEQGDQVQARKPTVGGQPDDQDCDKESLLPPDDVAQPAKSIAMGPES